MWAFGVYKVVSGVLSFALVMVLVAFFILSERKFLGYIQLRKGPNKVGLVGLLQSFADFIKLLSKGVYVAVHNRSWYSLYSVIMFLVLSCVVCFLYSLGLSGASSSFWFLWVLVVGGVISHCIIGLSWGSYNKYAVMACVRFAFVSMSFEACFMCVVLIFGFVNGSYNTCLQHPYGSLVVLIVPCCYIIWLVVLLGECNRVPFDYGEAESELVSGLNVEYSGVPFIAIFACEYLLMYFFSWLTCVLFWGGYWLSVMFVFHLIFFVWCRGSLPRIRFDSYVFFMWEVCLTISLFSLMIVIGY